MVYGLFEGEFEKKVKEKSEENLMKICWREKENLVKKELYSRQKERYYNRNGCTGARKQLRK